MLEGAEDIASHVGRLLKERPEVKAFDKMAATGKVSPLPVHCSACGGRHGGCCRGAAPTEHSGSGLPVSAEPPSAAPATAQGDKLRLVADKPVVLVLGSGWGAHAIMKAGLGEGEAFQACARTP